MNYQHYRKIRDEETRREYWREHKRSEREAQRPAKAKGKGAKKPPRRKTDNEVLGRGLVPAHKLAPPGEEHKHSYEQYHNGNDHA